MQVTIDSRWLLAGDIEVRTVPLDELAGARRSTFRGEMDVLSSGDRALAQAKAVLFEMNFISKYDGDAKFNTLHPEMDRWGFPS